MKVKRILLMFAVSIFSLLLSRESIFAKELEYHKVYKLQPGMSVEDIMQIQNFIQYTKFANDYQSTGYVYLIEANGSKRQRTFLRKRIILGRPTDNIAYKDFTSYTGPTSVKGLSILSWSYTKYGQDPDQWLWIPSLKKIRKVSVAQGDDSFMGSDFTTEEITTRKFEDETYKLIEEEKFGGYTAAFDGKTYKQGADCYVVEARPKRSPWYYSKRIAWIEKATGGDIFQEVYDQEGRKFKTLLKIYENMEVNGRKYPTQTVLECKDLRTNHETVIEMKDIKFDQGLEERDFSEKVIERSKW